MIAVKIERIIIVVMVWCPFFCVVLVSVNVEKGYNKVGIHCQAKCYKKFCTVYIKV